MKKILFMFVAIVCSTIVPSYALETTGTLSTGSAGLSVTVPCSPSDVDNGSVDENTCEITCDSNYTLAGQTCNLNTGGSGGGGGGGGGGSSSSSSSSSGGGGGSSSSSSSSSGGSSSTSGGGSGTSTVDDIIDDIVDDAENIIPGETEENIIDVASDLNNSSSGGGSGQVSGRDATDTIRNQGVCNFSTVEISYSDTNDSWAMAYIRDLSKRGIVNGVNNDQASSTSSFEPERPITRAEFLKIAMKSFCYDYSGLVGDVDFEDVEEGSWVARLTELAGTMGIIDTSNTMFRPNDPISKIEATKMIIAVASKRSSNFTLNLNATTRFSDVTVDWMIKYAAKADELDIIDGNLDGNFEPNSFLDRAQAAKIVVRAMNAQ